MSFFYTVEHLQPDGSWQLAFYGASFTREPTVEAVLRSEYQFGWASRVSEATSYETYKTITH